MSARDNKAVVRRLYEAQICGVPEALISPDYEPSLESVRRPYREEDVRPMGWHVWRVERDIYHDTLCGLRFEVGELVAEGNFVMAIVDVHGTPDQPLSQSRRLIGRHRVKEGRLTHIEFHWITEQPVDETPVV